MATVFTLSVFVAVTLKGALILALGGVAALLCRGCAAALRHLIWLTALAGSVALPVLAALLPVWHLAVPGPWAQNPVSRTLSHPQPVPMVVAEVPSEGVSTEDTTAPAKVSRSSDEEAAPSPPTPVEEATVRRLASASRLPDGAWPLALWVAGVLVAALPVVLAVARLRRLRRTACSVTGGRLAFLLRELADALGLRRPVALLQSRRRVMPMTWGCRRPVVLLPASANMWTPDRLRVVLVHELAHVKRWDSLTQTLAVLVRAVYWFNPLAWLAVAQLRVEQERACDDVVLRTGTRAPDYAEHVLAVTAGLASPRFLSPVALAVGRAGRLERRLEWILDPARSRRPLTRGTAGLVIVAAASLLLPLASVRLQPAEAARVRFPSNPEQAAETPEDAQQLQRLAEVRSRIHERYVTDVNAQQVTDGAIRGMLEALHDPYSAYLPAEGLAAADRETAGRLSGIGIQIRLEKDEITVVTPIEDSPALKAGIRPGDMITAIDGQPTKGLTLADAVQRILGRKGTAVKLTLRRAGETFEVPLTRAQIKVHSVRGFRRGPDNNWEFLLEPDKGLGYVQITHFNESTSHDLREVLQALKKKLRGLILDLRFCPGGLLSAAFETVELFIPQGLVVTVKGNRGEEKVYRADGKAVLADTPLLVLVNEQTASAAEIVAGALKDNGRATLVGTRTYGKGSVQEIVKLTDGGALKLTTAHYFLPSGRSIQKAAGAADWGVDPTDGYYLPVDARQNEALLKDDRKREILGPPGAKQGERPLTPERIAEEHADPQLAASLRAMIGKVTTGEMPRVGKSVTDMKARLARVEEIRKRRDELMKNLDHLNRELADLEKGEGEKRP